MSRRRIDTKIGLKRFGVTMNDFSRTEKQPEENTSGKKNIEIAVRDKILWWTVEMIIDLTHIEIKKKN